MQQDVARRKIGTRDSLAQRVMEERGVMASLEDVVTQVLSVRDNVPSTDADA